MFFRHRNRIVLAGVLLLQLLLLAYQVRRDQDVRLIRYWSILLVTPVQETFHWVTGGIGSVWKGYVNLRGVRRENEQLVRELDDLQMDYRRLESQVGEAARLRVLLDFKRRTPSETVAARVISSSSSPTAHLVTIDKGSDSGIRPDIPVIVAEGIVGKVLHVFPSVSQVQLITDSNSGVACLLETTRVHGILLGQSQPLARLGYVINAEKVEIGERLFTSGEDQVYPKGLPVGVVVSARPGNDFQEVTVQPAARLNRLEEVLVIVNKVDAEIARSGPENKTAISEPGNRPLAGPENFQ